MKSIRIGVVLVTLATVVGLVACTDEEEPSSTSSSLGPQCEKYYGSDGCCAEVAGDTQAAKDACAQGEQVIQDGISRGAKSADYEAACEQGIKAAQAIDKCK